MKKMFLLLGALALCSQTVSAATHIWSGAGANKNWSTAANWSAGGVPSANEATCSIVFPESYTGVVTNNIPGLRVDSIRFLGSGVSVQGALGATLRLKGTPGTNVYSAGMNYIFGTLPVEIEGTNRLESPVLLGLYTRISGTGSIETRGNVRFDGDGANTYTGSTIVKSGALTLGKEAVTLGQTIGLVSVPGPLIVEEGQALFSSDNGIANGSQVEIQPGGLLNLNGHNDTAGEIVLKGGSIQTGSGVLSLNGNVSATGNSTISGKLSLGGSNRTFDVAAGRTLAISAIISSGGQVSTAGLTKTGPGKLVLSGANTYAGHTAVNLGTLEAQSSSSLGSSFLNTTSVGQGSTLLLGDGVIVQSEGLSLFSGTLSCAGTGAWVGPISLNGACIMQSVAGGELALTGVISGDGALECAGTGRVLMAGTNSNTFTGTTSLSGGSLFLAKSDDAVAIHGNLVIGSPFHTNNADLLYIQESHQIADTSSVTILSSGVLGMNSVVERIGDLTLHGGEIKTGNGTLQLAGTIDVNPSTQVARISGRIWLNGAEKVFNVLPSATWPALEVSAMVSGGPTTTVRLAGGGSMLFSGHNTYSGPTIISSGELVVDDPDGLGAAGSELNGTVVEPAGTLNTTFAGGPAMERLVLSGAGPYTNGAWIAQGNNQVWGGEVVLTNDAAINVVTLKHLSITNRISGGGDLRKIGGGTLTFGGSIHNYYDGLTYVDSGILSLAKTDGTVGMLGNVRVGYTGGSATLRCLANEQLPSGRTVVLGPLAVLDMANRTETFGSLRGDGEVRLGNGLLTVSSGDYSGVITGAGGRLRVQNSLGGIRLRGTNTYTGATYVDNASLWVDGAIPDVVHVSSGGLLGGNGSVGGTDCSGGTVSPGVGFYDPETLKLQNLILTNGSSFVLETREHAAGGWDRDQADVQGLVRLNNAKLDLRLGAAGNSNIGYMLIKNAGNDPVEGTFDGLPEGATFTHQGAQFQITYQSGDGNDVVLKQLTTSTNQFNVVLSIAPYGTNWMRVTWPSFASGYQLQSSTNATGPHWITHSYLDGNDGTNCWYNSYRGSSSPAGRFFRLMRPAN